MPNPRFRYRFVLLFHAIVLFLLVSAYVRGTTVGAAEATTWRDLVRMGGFFVLLMCAVYAVSERRRNIVAAGGLIAAIMILQVAAISGAFPTAGEQLRVLSNYVAVVLLAQVVVLTLRYLFKRVRVDIDVIASSLCAYLILAILFALVFSIMSYHDDGAFNRELSPRSGRVFEAMYFSLVTITTLGYGDITPQTPWAKMVSALAAVVGQFYLAVLVARLVGLSIAPVDDER